MNLLEVQAAAAQAVEVLTDAYTVGGDSDYNGTTVLMIGAMDDTATVLVQSAFDLLISDHRPERREYEVRELVRQVMSLPRGTLAFLTVLSLLRLAHTMVALPQSDQLGHALLAMEAAGRLVEMETVTNGGTAGGN